MISLGFLFIGLVLIAFIFILNRFLPDKRLSAIPTLGLITTLKLMTQDVPYDVGSKLMAPVLQRYKVMKMLSFGNWTVIVSHPESIRAILSDSITFPKGLLTEAIPGALFARYMGTSLAFSNGHAWKIQRKVLSPPFHLAFDPALFFHLTMKLVESIHSEVNVHDYTQKLTLDALGSAMLGIEFDTISGNQSRFIKAYKNVTNHYLDYFYLAVPKLDSPLNPFRKSMFADLDYIKSYLKEIIAQRRTELGTCQDILSLMIQSCLDSETEFSDEDLLDNLLMFLVAGHDTTSFALSAALFQLSLNLGIQEKAYEEALRVLGPKPNAPSNEQTKQLHFIDAIISETMRMYPPSAILALRIAKKDITINGFDIPAGTGIIPDIMGMHNDPEYWPDPTKFNPDRFLNNSNPGPWLAFSGGERMCLGHGFSLLEQRVVLSFLILKFKFHPSTAKNSKLTLMPGLLLRPQQFYLVFEPRSQ